MTLSIGDLLRSGQRARTAEHNKDEKGKIGNLRGGTCGLMDEDQRGRLTAVGYCPRIAYLRMLGFSEKVELSTGLMFELGVSNEDSWYANLKEVHSGKILREDEVPVVWNTGWPSGRIVTGRPDIVLCDGNSIPTHGIELKQICSLWTAKDILSGKPKINHLIQAAFYKWRLGVQFGKVIDWGLWYTSRTNFTAPDWAHKFFPKKGAKLSETCEYGVDSKTGQPKFKNVGQFTSGFTILGNDTGDYSYQQELNDYRGPVIQSIVSPERIEKFYKFVDGMDTGEVKDLGPRPTALEADGTKGGFDQCDYCSLKDVCDSLEKNKAKWMEAVASHQDYEFLG